MGGIVCSWVQIIMSDVGDTKKRIIGFGQNSDRKVYSKLLQASYGNNFLVQKTSEMSKPETAEESESGPKKLGQASVTSAKSASAGDHAVF